MPPFAFSPEPGEWIEIRGRGTLLPGGGEGGEPVIVSDGFVRSLKPEVRASRGFVEIADSTPPGNAIGYEIADVDGNPTRVWLTE